MVKTLFERLRVVKSWKGFDLRGLSGRSLFARLRVVKSLERT